MRRLLDYIITAMRFLLLAVAASALALPALAGAVGPGERAPRLERLDGAPLPSSGAAPDVLLFWRADCGPCLLEMADLAALRAAARPGRVTPVGLQPAATLRPALRRLGLDEADTATTREDPGALLTRLGGAPPRLPLAVALRSDGQVCGRHSGLLGRDQVRAWARSCGGADARR